MDVDAAVAAFQVVHGVVCVGAGGGGETGCVVGWREVLLLVGGGLGPGGRGGRGGEGVGAEAVGEGGVAA